MQITPRQIVTIMVILIGVMDYAMANAAGENKYLSPQDLVADRAGKTLYVTETTANAVVVVDLASGKVARRIELPAAPGGLALDPDGARLYVTAAVSAGKVLIIDLASGKICGNIPVGHTPVAPVVSPDGKRLYVCNRFSNDVSAIDLATGKETARVAVLREPVAAALTPDGGLLFVANQLPAGPANADVVAAAVSVIDTKTNRAAGTAIALPNGSTGLHGICASPDGKYVYVTHTLGRYQLPTTQLERGWMNTNALSVIDAAGKTLINTVLLDDVDLGAANPWGVACSADGRFLCVTHAGTAELSVIDRAGLHERLDRVAAGQRVNEVTTSPADVPNDLSFLVGLRQRVKLDGNGPRGLAVSGGKAYAAEYFSGGVAEVNLDTTSSVVTRVVVLGAQPAMTAARKGEMFFNDANLCFQQWQSCASCHPDARVDGLNWDLLNDGIGNPKNVKSMLLAHKTPPVMSLGVRQSAEYAVRSGIKFIQFAVRPEEDAAAIDEYLKALKPVPSPHLGRDGKQTPAALRGKAVFEKAGCGMCHAGPSMTNLQSFDLGTGTGMDAGKPMDTPTLIEVWRTAPYLHDGRARTIKDVLTVDNPKNRHGNTRGLTGGELNDLAEYVLSQ